MFFSVDVENLIARVVHSKAKTESKGEEEVQEVSASLASAKGISMDDAAVMASLLNIPARDSCEKARL